MNMNMFIVSTFAGLMIEERYVSQRQQWVEVTA